MNIQDILSISSGAGFEKAALELFAFQHRHCRPYREYISGMGINTGMVDSVEKIPYLPVEVFKYRKVYCGENEAEAVFTSSTSGGDVPSKHYMAYLSDYELTFRRAFSLFYGDPADWTIYALLPGYLEREGSSLIYMAENLIKSSGGGFYLREHEQLAKDLAANPGKKLLLGVTYALLDFAAAFPAKLENTLVMETGGMKGRREELSKKEVHSILCEAFGIDTIHSEYGMAELTSQAYSTAEELFRTPPWMKIYTRDVNDPLEIYPAGKRGGVNIIDLANISSCAFLQTSDSGTVYHDGSFRLWGRIDRSEIRGCNLLAD